MRKIGELLVENRIITQDQLNTALKKQDELPVKKPVGEILVEMKVITIESLIKFLEMQLKQKFNKTVN